METRNGLSKLKAFKSELEQSFWGQMAIGKEVTIKLDEEHPAVEIEPILDAIYNVEFITAEMKAFDLTCYFTGFGCEKYKMRIL